MVFHAKGISLKAFAYSRHDLKRFWNTFFYEFPLDEFLILSQMIANQSKSFTEEEFAKEQTVKAAEILSGEGKSFQSYAFNKKHYC